MACFLTCVFPIDTCLSATSVHRSDDSTHESPLPLLATCTHSTFSIDASLLMSTCILSIDTCLLVICERGLDDSSHVSPLHLPTTCTHSTFSTVACFLFGVFSILIVATCLDAHGALGLDDFVYNSPLPTACTSSTLAFAIALLVSLHDLSVTESSTDSTLFRLLLLAVMLWQDASARVKGILLSLCYSFRWSASPQDSDESTGATCTFVRSIFGTSGSGRDSRNPPLPSLLWHFAIAIFHDIIVNLICVTCKNSVALMCHCVADCFNMIGSVLSGQFTSRSSIDVIDSSLDIEQSIHATCASPRLDFTHLSSGWDLRSPPLPSSVTIMTPQKAEEDALTWASSINSEESLPLNSNQLSSLLWWFRCCMYFLDNLYAFIPSYRVPRRRWIFTTHLGHRRDALPFTLEVDDKWISRFLQENSSSCRKRQQGSRTTSWQHHLLRDCHSSSDLGRADEERAWPEICLERLFSFTLGMFGRSQICVVGGDDLPQSACHHFSWDDDFTWGCSYLYCHWVSMECCYLVGKTWSWTPFVPLVRS